MTDTTPILNAGECTCDHPDCANNFLVHADNTTPHLLTEEGGKYFCSPDCRETFPWERSLQERLGDAFAHARVPSPYLVAAIFCREFGPQVTELEPGADGARHFRIANHPAASLISCAIGGDDNFAVHVGPDGIEHTPLRINSFALVISRVHPDALLREIRSIIFTRPVPLGAAIIITATPVPAIPNRTAHEVSAIEEATGKAVCRRTRVETKGT